jgi:hypothetical protein
MTMQVLPGFRESPAFRVLWGTLLLEYQSGANNDNPSLADAMMDMAIIQGENAKRWEGNAFPENEPFALV